MPWQAAHEASGACVAGQSAAADGLAAEDEDCGVMAGCAVVEGTSTGLLREFEQAARSPASD